VLRSRAAEPDRRRHWQAGSPARPKKTGRPNRPGDRKNGMTATRKYRAVVLVNKTVRGVDTPQKAYVLGVTVRKLTK